MEEAAKIEGLSELAALLRRLRQSRQGAPPLTYRALAERTGWSRAAIGEYFTGRTLPPTDRFDVLVRLLGATGDERAALAAARDRVAERLRDAPTGGTAAAWTRVVAMELPADVFAFTGRSAHLAELDRLVRDRPGSAVVLAAVSGMAGVGKTALAVHWAHHVAPLFPDGQLYVDLRGYDGGEPMAPDAALARLLRSLGVANADVPSEMEARAARYQTLMMGRRILLLLDNAARAEQVRPLIPGSPSCVVVVTSRDDLSELVARDGAHRVDLDVLTPAEAEHLLRAVVGSRVGEEPAAAADLAEHCGRLPLALRVVAELAVARPASTLADLVTEFGDERRRLDVLELRADTSTALRAVLSWSLRHLSADAARAFALLGLHPGRMYDGYALASLMRCDPRHAEKMLSELARAHLVVPIRGDRYALHDLLRLYAAERAEAETSADLVGLFDYYLSAAAVAARALYPFDEEIAPPTTSAPVPDLTDERRASAWLDEERANLVAVATSAVECGSPDRTVALSRTLRRYLNEHAFYPEALVLHTQAVRASGSDAMSYAAARANLGIVLYYMGRPAEAVEHLQHAVAVYREVADVPGQARVLGNLAVVHGSLGQHDEALRCLGLALDAYRETGNRAGEGQQLVNLGAKYGQLGRYAEAVDLLRDGAAACREVGDRNTAGYALCNLGATLERLDRCREAADQLEQSLTVARELGDRRLEGYVLVAFASVHMRLGRSSLARGCVEEALVISRELSEPWIEAAALNSYGVMLRELHQPEEAHARHEEALEVAERVGERYEQARALNGIAERLREAGSAAQARQHWQRALTLFDALGVPEAGEVRAHLAELTE